MPRQQWEPTEANVTYRPKDDNAGQWVGCLICMVLMAIIGLLSG